MDDGCEEYLAPYLDGSVLPPFRNLGRDWKHTCLGGSAARPVDLDIKVPVETPDDDTIVFDYIKYLAQKERAFQ